MATKLEATNLIHYISKSVELSWQGLGYVSPNPCVGCVILDANFELLAQGYHKKYGESHAEVEALKEIKHESLLKGAWVIVTLEPCAHQGLTPSCAQTLSRLPIAGVLALVKDPNPLVTGKGFEILQKKGVACVFLQDLVGKQNLDLNHWPESMQEALKQINQDKKLKRSVQNLIHESLELNRTFFYAIQNPYPYITLKWAQSFNGVMGSLKKRLLISNAQAQRWTHLLRAQRDLTLVGATTVLQDDPLLNIRLLDMSKHNAIAVIDPQLECLREKERLKIFRSHAIDKIFIITSEMERQNPRVQNYKGQIIYVEEKNSELDLKAALKVLKSKHNIHSILVEGGSHTLKRFYKQKLWNEIYIYMAFKILFGVKAPKKIWSLLLRYKCNIRFLGSNLMFWVRKN